MELAVVQLSSTEPTQLPGNTTCHVYFCPKLEMYSQKGSKTKRLHKVFTTPNPFICGRSQLRHKPARTPVCQSSMGEWWRFFKLFTAGTNWHVGISLSQWCSGRTWASLSSHIQRSTSRSEVAYALQTHRLPHRVSNHRLKVRSMTHAQRGLCRDGQTSDMSTRRWI